MIKKIHHLIRYFLILGMIAFVGFLKHLQTQLFLFLIGPCLYISYTLKSFIANTLFSLPPSAAIQFFGFLLPVTLLYFGFIGFQLKQLWNEKGKIRIVILVVFILFIIYIHVTSFKTLSIY